MFDSTTYNQTRVTVRIDPKDRRRTPSCLDFVPANALALHSFLIHYQANPTLGTVSIVRGADLPWAQEIISQLPVVA